MAKDGYCKNKFSGLSLPTILDPTISMNNVTTNNLVQLSFLSIFMLISLLAFAQDCDIQKYHKHCMANDPIYKEGFLKNEAYMEQQRLNPQIYRNSQNGPYVLPMVVHIIHIGENHSSNISEQEVLASIERLNNDFNGSLNAANIDTEIQFCLATIDPNGNPTNGINRVNGSGIVNYTTFGINYTGTDGASQSLVKDLSLWPTSEYMNVWVVHRISGNAGAFASFPNGGIYDGIVMQPHNLNSEVFAHEVGHNLNLLHTFHGNSDECIENEDCLTQGDKVCDTPAHQIDDCNSTTCSSTNYFQNVSRNFMSYCSSRVLFTSGQKERMQQTINGPIRKTLLSSIGCAPSLPLHNVTILELKDLDLPVCNGLVSPIIKVRNNGARTLNSFEVQYRVNDGPYSNQIVVADLSFGAEEYFILEGIQMALDENNLEVRVLNPNGFPDEYPEHDELEIVFQNTVENVVVTTEYFEDFESYYDLDFNLLPSGYSTYALNKRYSSWNHVQNGVNVWLSASGFGLSGEVEVDVLQMPTIDLSETDNAKLSFRYSFTRFEDFNPDGYGLKVVAYRGCDGVSEILWEKYDFDLQSAPVGPPNAIESYKSVSLDLSAYKDELVKIEFHYCYTNRDFYTINLDNILVQGDKNGNIGSCQIPISPQMIFNPDGTQASANSGGASLFDEQDIVGQPDFGLGSDVGSPWVTPYAPDQNVYLDLGESYNISALYYYDTNGQGEFKIKPTLPEVPSTQEISFDCSAWPIQWVSQNNLNWQTRYITFTKSEIGAHVGEIYICGSPADGIQATCQDGIQNQNETGIDCGGFCPDCPSGNSDCEENIEGYTFYGTFENHNYYLSKEILTWSQADLQCQQNGGDLLTVNNAAENSFIQENLENRFVLIGLNDAVTEGVYNWSSNETFNYNNITSGNTSTNDYGMMNFWDGSWTFVGANVRKYHILEIACDDSQGTGITLNCPDNLEILLPFQATSGQVIYDVSATTDCANGDVTIDIDGIPSGGSGIFGRYPIEITATDECGNSESCSFIVDLITRQHFSSANCPEDITVTASDENGAIVTWEEATAITDCESLTLSYQGFYSSGDLIPIGTHQIDYAWREEGPESICGGNASCNFQVTVLPQNDGGACPNEIMGYDALGEFGGSKYYISTIKKNWQDAQLEVLINTNGHLASINSEEENEFIRSKIGNEIVSIGLSDARNEGMLTWDSGEPYSFTKLEVANSDAGDNGYMNFWNGNWGLDHPFAQRFFILEVPCEIQEEGPKPDMTLSNFSYNESSVLAGEVLFFEVDISNIGDAISGAFSLKSYISTDRNLSSDDVQDGVINTNNFLAGQTVQNVTGALTVPANLPDGNYYVILEVDADNQLDELSENNNILAANSQFDVSSTELDCSEVFPNATYIGERTGVNSKSIYFISNDTYLWEDGKTFVQNNGGNLASVNSSGENQFLYQRLNNNIVFIGLNDAQTEGAFVWESGDPFILNNLTDANSTSNDYAHMNFWNGAWGMDGRWTKRKLLIEVECSNEAASADDLLLRESNTILSKERIKITQLYPNPASDLIHVEIQSLKSKKIQMKVYSMEGQLVKSEMLNVSEKLHVFPLEVRDLNSGIYQIIIFDEEGYSYSERFMKAKN